MKKNLFLLLFIVINFFAAYVRAQQYSYIPATTVANNIPWGSATSNLRQNLYYPADFAAPSGSITTLYIKPSTAITTISFTNVTVKMGPSALTTFASGPWATGLTTVYTGAATMTANAGGWLSLTLQTPYAYNNTQNLIVEFSQTGNSATISVLHDNTAAATNRSLYGAATATSGTIQSRLQQLGFDMVACTAPSGLAATGVTATGASVNWGAVTGSTGYEWAVTTSATPPATGTPVATTSYNASGLTPATTYYFHVRNICSPTSASAWTTISFTTSATCVAPSAPVISSIAQNTATATWGAVPGSTGYEWFVSTSATPPASGTATALTSQNLASLASGTQYYVHVRNVCSGGLFSAWATTSFTTLYPPCVAPSGLSVSSINVSGATISWNAVAGSSGYEWVATTSATPPASGTAASGTTVNASGLTGGTLYYVHLRNNCGAGGFSPWVTTTFTTSSSCAVPSNILITNIGPISANIQWDPVPGAVGFEYIIDNSPQSPVNPGAAIAFNQYAPNNLISATRYFVHLRTNCGSAGGFSSWVTVQFTTDTICFAPVAVIEDITGTTANITWQAEANAVNYQYLVSTSITPPFSGYATTATRYVAKGLNKNTQYYMHLRSYCGGNDISAWRSTGFVTNEQTLGVTNSGANDLSLTAYPNPVNNVLTIKLKGWTGNVDGRVSMVDITGKTLLSEPMTATEKEIDVHGLANGMYFLQYRDADHATTIKINKQ